MTPFEGGKLSPEQVLVIGAGRESAGSPVPAGQAAAIAEFVKAGGHVLALGLNEQQANAFLPAKVQMKPGEHIATFFQPLGVGSLLEGVGPADAHNRDPRALPLVAGGAVAAGNGVLARANGANVVFCQLPPYTVSKAEGAVPTSIVTAEDAAEGKQSALVTMGSVSGLGARVGQKVAAGTMGKTYTFAAMVKPLGEAVTARLEIERPAKVTGQVAKGENVLLPEGQWTELHVTFRAPEAAAEGWALYLTCAQEGARLRADQFRLYEGEYVAGAPAAANLITNPGFEDGVAGWQFTFHEQHNLRRTYRRTSFTLSRLLGNMGAGGATPVLERFSSPVKAATEKRWQDGLYLDQPTEWDEPYRFFRW